MDKRENMVKINLEALEDQDEERCFRQRDISRDT